MNKRQLLLLAVLVIAVGAMVYLNMSGDKPAAPPAPAPATPTPPSAQVPPKPATAPTAPGAPSAPGVPAAVPAKSEAPQQPAALPVELVVKPLFAYVGMERRDPFAPLIVPKVAKPDLGKEGKKTFGDYDPSEYKLSAVLLSSTGYYAVITLPNGEYFNITERDRRFDGTGKQVYRITPDSVIIREIVKDKTGVHPKDTTIKLRTEGEE